jgi:2-C-methyl-D-erythritol 4-phosphate cytidylyltransferase
MTKQAVIIVAGGQGTRMGSLVPKQFLLLRNKPVLMHTIEAFYNYNNQITIVLTLPANQLDYWKDLCNSYHFDIPHTTVKGGETRFHSVKQGLEAVAADTELIAVHDGVRPFPSAEAIARCFDTAATFGAVIPVIPVVETVRQITSSNSVTIDRENLRLVQTPQVFDGKILKEAYNQEYISSFTDDASVVEAAGHSIVLVEGNRENIKITNPTDLIVAEAFIGE